MNSSDKAKKLYNIYYSAKSTGFIVPILYLYLQEILGLQTSQILIIAAGYQLLPFILEVPLGYIGDKFGNKKVVLLGLAIQILSFIFLLIFKNAKGYHFYLVCMYFAGAAYSGAETSIIRAHFRTDENLQFRSYFTNVSTLFYRNTIAFLIVGVIAYRFLNWLPLVLQVICYSVAFIIMLQIEDLTHDKHAHHSLSSLKNDNKQVIKYIFKNNRFLGLVIIEAIFASSILINHKTIQQTLSKLLKLEPYVILGLVYVAGNNVSYKGSKYFKDRFLESLKIKTQLIVFASIMVLSFVFMAIPNFIFITFGFLFICLFKSIYRPVISSELSNNILLMRFHSTTLSYVSLIGAAISTIIDVAIAPLFKDYFWGNIAFVLITIIPLSIGFYLYSKKHKFSFVTETSPLTRKRNVLSVVGDKTEYIQFYPNTLPDNHFINLEKNINESNLSSPLQTVFNIQNKSLSCEFLGDKNLSRIDQKKQYYICNKILDDLLKNANKKATNYAYHPPVEQVFNSDLNEKIKKLIIQQPVMGILHGDLHPLNIMIVNEDYFAIDWDNSGYGPLWFDALTLISSPYLSLNYNERLQLLKKQFPELEVDSLRTLLIEFSNFKAKQVKGFEFGDGFYLSLSKKYFLMIKNFKIG